MGETLYTFIVYMLDGAIYTAYHSCKATVMTDEFATNYFYWCDNFLSLVG